MKIIESIKTKSFRSLRDVEIPAVGDLTAIAGHNGSGKSNLLRVLNAFFSGFVEGSERIQVDEDFHRPDLKKKKKKAIEVEIVFNLPAEFTFQKNLKAVENYLGSRRFSIKKIWNRDSSIDYSLNDKSIPSTEDKNKIDQFLSLINFRYIPNRVVPTEIIKGEHKRLRDLLVKRLSKKKVGSDDLFKNLAGISTDLAREISNSTVRMCSDISSVKLATAESWKDMVFAFGYRLRTGDIDLDDSVQGSGVQSLLMLQTLSLLDCDYSQFFGWKQATVWALEEPESSLHATLEAQVASYIAGLCNDPKNRLQTITSTHSNYVLQAADTCYLVTRTNLESKFEQKTVKDAMESSSILGVGHWVHPLIMTPPGPLLLVDGKFDVDFVRQALKLLAPQIDVMVACVETFGDGSQTGGEDQLHTYLKANLNPLSVRCSRGKVIVLLDWESNKENKFKSLNTSANFNVIKWSEDAFNPKLGKAFRGIERHYSDRIIEAADKNSGDVLTENRKKGIKSVDAADKEKFKIEANKVVKAGISLNDLTHSREFFNAVIGQLQAST